MPLLAWGPSLERRQAFETGLLHFIQTGRVSQIAQINPNPQPIHAFSLHDTIGKTNIIQALPTPVSWRYFAQADGTAVVSGEINAQAQPQLTALRRGPQVAKTFEAIAALAQIQEINSGNWQPRILRIPGLLIEAFWLTLVGVDSGQGSLIVPASYYPNFLGLTSDRAYRVDEFLDLIRPFAERVLTMHDSPPGVGPKLAKLI